MIVLMHILMLLRMMIAMCVVRVLGETRCLCVAMWQHAGFLANERKTTLSGVSALSALRIIMVSSAVIAISSVSDEIIEHIECI
jgi:hypothetical protein